MSDTDARGKSSKVGAVAVVGAGIGGMQASLDLANAGYKVYLVEKSAAIGGKMAQLDKTFPTNDCSMCIISPKLVEVGRHRNIELMTHTEVSAMHGRAGDFSLDLSTQAKYIDPATCTGCGECANHCPVVLPNEFDEGLSTRKAVYKRFPQAIPNAFSIDKRGTAPCKIECPAHISVQGYVALTAEGKFAEALTLIKKDNPLPAVCGRVCHHPCETACTRGEYDEPIAIKSIKRFLADMEPELDIQPPKPETEYGDKVAIVGSGPGGLSAAYYLAINGYKPTVFESGPQLGGMLRTGIPPYRLPREVLDAEIGYIRRAGVMFELNAAVGKDVTLDALREKGFKAFFLATGAHAERSLKIPGEEKPGVLSGYGFLRSKHLGEPVEMGKKVVVVGGGNVAMDAARTALRMGADVTVVYRRTREQMPALPEEIHEAEDENIKFDFLCSPVEVLGDGKVEKLKCQRMELGEPDDSGRRRPVPVENDFVEIVCDTVISAIGQFPELTFLSQADAERVVKWDRIVNDPVTFSTAVSGVFAGGDAVLGPATAIEAIAAGKETAESIHRFLRGKDLREGRSAAQKAEVPPLEVTREKRMDEPLRAAKDRAGDFGSVFVPLTEEAVVAEAKRCVSCGICSECYLCVEACQAGAVIHNDLPGERTVQAGSVILAPGFETFDPQLRGEYGYGVYPNVVTSIEFERILSASGPYQGHVKRPSDGREPKKIAWIQCVGSRDAGCGNEHCSSVCCMYATKEAVIAAEHLGEVDAAIFYMDLRAHGKGFDDYIDRAKKAGVRFVRSMVSRIVQDPQTGDLELRHMTESGELHSETFDMVVLSVGMQIPQSVRELADRLNVKVGTDGFASTSSAAPLSTSVPGVYVAGAFAGPKDIPETVAEASAAAACAASDLGEVRHTQVIAKTPIPERQVKDKEPRIGVFVCHCGINISSIVNVAAVTEYARTLPGVVFTSHNLYTCSQDTQEKIKELIEEHDLNRVVVASCSPRTHEPLFQQTLQEAGLNAFLFDMANIRDQCSWVNRADKLRATEKSKDLVRMAVANATLTRPLYEVGVKVTPRCLIVGGGLAGMTAALELSKQGFESVIIERSDKLGGNLSHLRRTADGVDVQRMLNRLIDQVRHDSQITVLVNGLIVDFTGYVGNYETEVMVGPGTTRKINHGALILATGGGELSPSEYLYGESDQVVTQNDLEQMLTDSPESAERLGSIAMIQCVGSREEGRSYCSRVCCNQALKNALAYKELRPEGRVVVFYRDIRSYGLNERLYSKARDAGVLFVRYDPEMGKPTATLNGGLTIEAVDPVLGSTIRIKPDLLALSPAIVAGENEELGSLLKLARNEHGFFIEAHAKLRPVDFASEGIYLAGLAHGPKSIPETISQAQAAVARAATLLAFEEKRISGVVSRVEPERCAVCLTCVRACPYDIPIIHATDGTAVIDPTMCHGCGICAADCPGKAIQLAHFEDAQILAKTHVLVERRQT
jgi:heterodisulfide reductase subunit A2